MTIGLGCAGPVLILLENDLLSLFISVCSVILEVRIVANIDSVVSSRHYVNYLKL